MNWKECARQMEAFNPGERFHWPGLNGIDCSQDFTISDVWGAIAWGWTWPGDWVLSQEPLRTFFEIEPPTAIGMIASTVFGFLIAFVLIGILGLLFD